MKTKASYLVIDKNRGVPTIVPQDTKPPPTYPRRKRQMAKHARIRRARGA